MGGRENPETEPQVHGQLIKDRGEMGHHWLKGRLFSKWNWKSCFSFPRGEESHTIHKSQLYVDRQ